MITKSNSLEAIRYINEIFKIMIETFPDLPNKKASHFMRGFRVNDGARTHDPRYHKPML